MPKPAPVISMKKLLKASPLHEFGLALRLSFLYVRRGRKWTMALTIFLMAVAFVNLVFMSSLLNGIVKGTERQVRDHSSGEIYLAPTLGHKYIKDPESVIATLRQIPELDAISPQLLIYGELTAKDYSVASQIKVLEGSDQTFAINRQVTSGVYISDTDSAGILLGHELVAPASERQIPASLEQIKVNDEVNLKFGGVKLPLTVRGVFKTKYIEADRTALISRHTWKQLAEDLAKYSLPADLVPPADAVNIITIRTNPAEIPATLEKIRALSLPDLEAHPWKDSAGFMVSVTKSFLGIDAIMFVVGVVIAGVTIFIVIYVDVINKRRQIGIQRALGVKPRIIVTSYVFLSVFYAIFGILVGLAIFYLALVPYFDFHPLSLPVTDARLDLESTQLTLRISIVMFVSILSGLIPAIMATKTKMLDAILGRN